MAQYYTCPDAGGGGGGIGTNESLLGDPTPHHVHWLPSVCSQPSLFPQTWPAFNKYVKVEASLLAFVATSVLASFGMISTGGAAHKFSISVPALSLIRISEDALCTLLTPTGRLARLMSIVII